ncbi:hypothetical protein N7463_007495 [Penicillium fimorum]|uniref:Uncharacterized protein n=1 Tax=Penicillium fimorum TaxID=1882269 RepID=A0A9X0C7M5_9EURO|nr:hypothetical protein N7463_007495 [Penicillium fimorum]
MEFPPHGPPDPDIFLRDFRRIAPHIYDVPDDFIIKQDAKKCSLYEPVDDELWNLCAGRSSTTTHFTLDQIYDILLRPESCSHIWELFKQPNFSITRKSKIEEICSKKPGLYLVPSDLMIMRTNRQAPIGGYSYKLISKELHSDCQRLFALDRAAPQLRLAEIYAGLWILGGHPRSIFLGMLVIMRGWLQNQEFSITEEGALTRLVLQLGKPVKAQSIANLVQRRVFEGEYHMSQLLRDGGDHWYAKCEMLHSPHWQQPRGTPQELFDALF